MTGIALYGSVSVTIQTYFSLLYVSLTVTQLPTTSPGLMRFHCPLEVEIILTAN